jgi:hypothetical protein
MRVSTIGLLQDVGSASLLGFSGFTRGLVGLFTGLLGTRVLDIQSPSNIIFLFALSLADSLFSALFLEITYGSVPVFGLIFGRGILRAATTALAGYGILRLMTGKNVLGAWGFGAYFYFTDTISLLTGPVFYLDKDLQPGGREFLWTVQLDVDIPLGRK